MLKFPNLCVMTSGIDYWKKKSRKLTWFIKDIFKNFDIDTKII